MILPCPDMSNAWVWIRSGKKARCGPFLRRISYVETPAAGLPFDCPMPRLGKDSRNPFYLLFRSDLCYLVSRA